MPVAMYDVNNFLLQSLENIGYIDQSFASNESLTDKLTDFAMLSVGTNPRSLKRLINTLSLLNIIDKQKSGDKKQPYELVINFGLVCIQIAYPKVYQALLEEINFKEWSEKTAKKMRLPELTEAQALALKDVTEFDEEWETVLFRICQKDPYLSSRAFQISQLLNYLSELVPDNIDFTEELSKIIGTSAVTSVNLDYVPVQAKKGDKIRYEGWAGFEAMLKSNKNITPFIPNIKQIHDYFEAEYKDLIQFNYTPNFLTVACKFPASRSRTLVFIRLKKDYVVFEYAGKNAAIKDISDFSDELKSDLNSKFNELSIQKK
jgi:hypothetical protein